MSAEDGKGWGSLRNAARMRDWVRAIVLEVLDEEWPGAKFGTVSSIDRENSMCMVLYQGDDTPVTVRMYALQPSSVSQTVIIDGPRRRRSIVQVLGQTFIPGVPTAGWLQSSDSPIGRYMGFVAEVGQRIYFGGGTDIALGNDSFTSFDVDLNSWVVETPLPEGRTGAGADHIGLDLFVAGGDNAGVTVATIWKYDTDLNSWDDTLADMPGEKTDCGVAAWNDQVYVFGGISTYTPTETYGVETYCYDPGSNSWTTVEPLPSELISVDARAIGDYIYIFGVEPSTSENKLYRYDPVGDVFSEMATFPEMTVYSGFTRFSEKLAVIGGADVLTYAPSAKAWLYDPASDAWSSLQGLPTEALAGSAGHSSTKIVFHGGAIDLSSGALSSTFVYTPS